MKLRKLSAATAILASGALILTACTPGDDDETPDDIDIEENEEEGGDDEAGDDEAGGSDATTEGQEYTVEPDSGAYAVFPEDFETNSDTIYVSTGAPPFDNVNPYQFEAYSTYNSAVTGRLGSGFNYFGTDLGVYPNEEFGSYEVVSEDPFTVEYTIAEDAVWSDGTPITAADYILNWGAQAYDEAGFSPVGDSFATYVPEGPQAESHEDKTFTVEYPEFFADWELLVSAPYGAAHVLAEQTGLSVDELITAIQEGDVDTLTEAGAGEAWNTGYGFEGEWDPEVSLSSGPYVLSEWDHGESVTLTANPEWWGTPPGTETLVFQHLDDSQHVQALENGDLNVIAPQPDADTRTALSSLAEGGEFVLHEGEIATWEHLDLQWGEGSPFAETPELAEALALCVPRQQIVDNLIAPVNPEAEILDAREIFNFQDGYDEFVSESYDGRYDEPDVDAAREILEEHDAVGTTLRVYHSGTDRRFDTVALIEASCGENGAGFTFDETGDPEVFNATLPSGDWDLALFAWAGSGQIVSGQNIYSSDGLQNYNGYANEEVDELWDLVASDISDEERTEALIQIEEHLWNDLFGIPLHVHPGLNASDGTIANVRQTAAQDQIVWNAHQWQRTAE